MKSKVLYFFLILVLCLVNAGVSHGEEEKNLPASPGEFFLGPQDILEISVWKNEALTRQVVVRPDGKISFPLINDVQAAGRTVEELREVIREKIERYVPDAPVTVMVVELGSPVIYVVGKVAKPGLYLAGKPIRVMQALAMAGGTTRFADKGDILVLREEAGEQTVFKFDYEAVAQGENLSQNIVLKPNDTVVVP